MTDPPHSLPSGTGLWAGFLDHRPATEAVAMARDVEDLGFTTIWLQEFSGTDPFVRAALYLQATDQLTVALGVATIHARDAEAMVAAASTLLEAFPGRFILGLGSSHRHLAEARGTAYERPLATMRQYVQAMVQVQGRRTLPPLFLGALGPRMIDLAATETDGVHTYLGPVSHTASSRAAVGAGPWIAPTQLIADRNEWDGARAFVGACVAMPNYRAHLARCGFSERALDELTDELLDALVVVTDDQACVVARLAAHRSAGADHVVVQLVPPARGSTVLDRLHAGLAEVLVAR